jgi:hypothetical protein
MSWLFRQTVGRLPSKDIGDGAGQVFFRRYAILKTPIVSVYLHQFFRSDHDRCLHDHPWPFVSVILRGGYWEEVFRAAYRDDLIAAGLVPGPVERHWRAPGRFLFRSAATSHRIVLEPSTRPWSLVIVGRRVRDWGFWTLAGWEKWRPGVSPICEDGADF